MLSSKLRNILRISNIAPRTLSIFRNTNDNTYPVRTFCDKSSHIVQMRGLDCETSEEDVIEFFKPLGITPKAVRLKSDGSGRVAGICEVEFATYADAVVALRKKNAFMGNRFVRLALKSLGTFSKGSHPLESDGSVDNQKSTSQSASSNLNMASNVQSLHQKGYIVKMKNAPKRITDLSIYEFFWLVGASAVSTKALYNESGIRSGEFEVQFSTYNEALRAMIKNNTYLRSNLVELSLQK
ncbi:uncharacterized protein CEXT_64111 [Caerostris extrusa]|uniref:RRM domain-containing protein n=1 Tax=Caerostris extrusa TaxID=172846 RepID=A0AAV4Q5N4_CAEEX|nr:uncharacterized protein CEXT_64111 [Caerostris extrusa]